MRILISSFVISAVEDCSLGSRKLVFLKIFLTRARFKGYHDPTFVHPPGFASPIRYDLGLVNPIRPVRSDPILVLLTADLQWIFLYSLRQCPMFQGSISISVGCCNSKRWKKLNSLYVDVEAVEIKTWYRVEHEMQPFFPGKRITAHLSDIVVNGSTHTSSQWFKTN